MNTNENKKHQNYLITIKESDNFFSTDFNNKLSLSDYRFTDTDGLVQFVMTSQIDDKASVMKKLNEIKKTQIALSSIVTDYITKYSNNHGSQYKTDIQFWEKIIAKLPLMSVKSIESQSYEHEMKGVSIATNLLQLIMDILLNTYSPGLQSFANFLQKQGDAIRMGLKRNNDHYSTLTLASVIEATGIEDQVIYVPKMKLFKIDFDSTNSEVTSNCASNQNVNVKFSYFSCIALFDYQALENPEIKTAFDNFILKNNKDSIENSDSFFSGEFKP
ncbi:hypothetical protein FE394_03920 [Xenorhabdus sp. Reich]|uniref:Virulence factor Evf domain-containing protein n=1 Tax=Xenorhabdus littoralis TaxID=2582835 RepID=A0ABU4SI75_9GAMM|nr:hypothetical protein [Xenorhabdus sp. Reich]MDX7998365.1 hypothetical protein [Xenorhabdus sp. Reich]